MQSGILEDRADRGVGSGVGSGCVACRCELIAKGGQFGDDVVDLADPSVEKLIGGGARSLAVVGCVEDLGDLTDVQSELAGSGDKSQPGDVGFGVEAIAGRAARGGTQ